MMAILASLFCLIFLITLLFLIHKTFFIDFLKDSKISFFHHYLTLNILVNHNLLNKSLLLSLFPWLALIILSTQKLFVFYTCKSCLQNMAKK